MWPLPGSGLFVVSFLNNVWSRGTFTELVTKVISLRSFNFGSYPGNVICTNVVANATGQNSRMKSLDYSKSLEQLEKDYWGEPEYDSYVVRTCHSMRKKPLSEVTIEELRLVIGQGFSLEYLMPIAIEKLKENILAEGDLYEGDLFSNVISKSTFDYWRNHKSDWEALLGLYDRNKDSFDTSLSSAKTILKNLESFKAIHG